MVTAKELLDRQRDPMMTLIDDARDAHEFARANPIARDYAMGKFRHLDSSAKRQVISPESGAQAVHVSENLVGQCLNEISGRLRFLQYTVADDRVKTFLNDEFARKNNLSKVVVQINKRAKTDGNAAMSVSWRMPDVEGSGPGRPVINHERWWDGTHGVFLEVSDDGTVEWVVSDFRDVNKVERRTLWLPDRQLRFWKNGQGWEMLPAGEGEIPKVRADGRPLGIPFAHFPNGAPAFGEYGRSTVDLVIAAQDALNATLLNRQLVVAFTGMQVYWATGVTSVDDIEVEPGTLWHATDTGASFGAIPPGSIDELLKETEDLRATICGEFPVPSYRLGNGDWPAGLALQRADYPMIASAKLTGDVFEPGLVMIAHRATELYNYYLEDGDGEELDESSMISVEYRPADEVDPGTQVEIDQGRADLYASVYALPEPLLRKMQVFTEDEIKDLVKLKKEEKALIAQQAKDNGIEDDESDNGRASGGT